MPLAVEKQPQDAHLDVRNREYVMNGSPESIESSGAFNRLGIIIQKCMQEDLCII